MRSHTACIIRRSRIRSAASNANSWRSRSSAARALVVLLQREHAERDVARLVAHHVAQQLLEERLLRDVVHEAEGREREALDHDLHAHVRHVPARVAEHVVDEQLQVGVDGVVAFELRVEVAGEHLDVAGLVHDLGRRVVLGVDPRRRDDDLRRAEQRALLPVEELAHAPVERLDLELQPLLRHPSVRRASLDSSAIRCWKNAAAGAISTRDLLGVDVVDQSRSVEPFHCDVLAFS